MHALGYIMEKQENRMLSIWRRIDFSSQRYLYIENCVFLADNAIEQ